MVYVLGLLCFLICHHPLFWIDFDIQFIATILSNRTSWLRRFLPRIIFSSASTERKKNSDERNSDSLWNPLHYFNIPVLEFRERTLHENEQGQVPAKIIIHLLVVFLSSNFVYSLQPIENH